MSRPGLTKIEDALLDGNAARVARMTVRRFRWCAFLARFVHPADEVRLDLADRMSRFGITDISDTNQSRDQIIAWLSARRPH